MIIGNAKVFADGKFIDAAVTVEQGKIVAVGKADAFDVDAKGMYLVPGFLDLHTHGAVNGDFSDGKPEDLPAMSQYYVSQGVTSFLATTMTLDRKSVV